MGEEYKGILATGRKADRKRHAWLVQAERAWELRLTGLTGVQIARKLAEEGVCSLSPRRVQEILRNWEVWSRERIGDMVKQEKARQLDALQKVQAEAWAAWERSKEDEVLVRKKVSRGARPGQLQQAGGGEGRSTEVVKQERGQVGDVRYLEAARGAMADIRKMLGMDAAEKHEHEHREVGGALESVRGKFAQVLEPGEN